MTHSHHHHHDTHHSHSHAHGDLEHYRRGVQEKFSLLSPKSEETAYLEDIAVRLCAAQQTHAPRTRPCSLLCFLGDHEWDGPIPDSLREEYEGNRQSLAKLDESHDLGGIRTRIIDVGSREPMDGANTVRQIVRPGARDLIQEPALTIPETKQAMKIGSDWAARELREGSVLFVLAGFGFLSSVSAAAITAHLVNQPPQDLLRTCSCVGRMTESLPSALERHQKDIANPVTLLSHLGGCETAALAGAAATAADHGAVLLLDGWPAVAAAAVAARLSSHVRLAAFAVHESDHPGANLLMESCGWPPLMRHMPISLENGSVGLLALPILDYITSLLQT